MRQYGPWECDIATRKPAPLSASYADLCNAIPILKEFVYFVDGDRARHSYDGRPERESMHWLLENGADHWIPGDIFAQMTGAVSGTCKVYGSREKALEDAGLAWAKARPDGLRKGGGDEATRTDVGGGQTGGPPARHAG